MIRTCFRSSGTPTIAEPKMYAESPRPCWAGPSANHGGRDEISHDGLGCEARRLSSQPERAKSKTA